MIFWQITEDKVSDPVLRQEFSESLKKQESIFTEVKESKAESTNEKKKRARRRITKWRIQQKNICWDL